MPTAELTSEVTIKTKKKERSDKGFPKMQPRDSVLLGWIAEQYAIRLDQLQILIASKSENPKRSNPNTVSWQSAMQTVNRWRTMGWVEYRKMIHGVDNPGWIWLTIQGLRDFGFQYSYREPTISQFNHYFWVNQVRLSLEIKHGDAIKWTGERYLRFTSGSRFEHYPDGEFLSKSGRTAVEVELTQKTASRLKKIIDGLDFKTNDVGSNFYYQIVYYSNDSMIEVLRKATEGRDKFRVLNLKGVKPYG